MNYSKQYIGELISIAQSLDTDAIEKMADIIASVRERGGRLFFLGVGGGAGHASHAVNDFRKIAGIESYSPTDNVSELTARINDDGWDTSYSNWLKGSKLNSKDCIFVFSVGGGSLEKNISVNLVNGLKLAKECGASVLGIVGKDGGYTAKIADACLIVPVVNANTITPHTESFQANIWHLLVTHPKVKYNEMKWESASK
ncbi:MAG: SIS domain-containing protein [Ignavibacteria bacterium]|nr:SIS domain-containing protein [Ignavibacteria bacterium]